MEFKTPKVNFQLKTSSISQSNVVADYPLSNSKGSINQYRTSITWYGVSIKNLLGELYDNYEIFNIQMNSVGYSSSPTVYGVTADDLTVRYGITGLDWVYCNYNSATGNTTNEAVVVGLSYVGSILGSSVTAGQTNISALSFRKCVTTDITINLYTTMGTSPNMNVGTIFPQLFFGFVITPVK